MLILNIPFIAANINTLVFNLRSYFVTKRLQISIGKIKAHGSSAMRLFRFVKKNIYFTLMISTLKMSVLYPGMF